MRIITKGSPELDRELKSGNTDYDFLCNKFNVSRKYIMHRKHYISKNEKKAPIVLREIANSININGIVIEAPNREVWIKREKDGFNIRW